MIENIQAQKVTLVLSGGGAKGMAYIGAIRALEEHDIPIDNIIGTSMGGIVGKPSQLRVLAASLVLHSFLGPISLSGTYYEGGTFQPDKWLFLVNIGHLLLPRRPRRR